MSDYRPPPPHMIHEADCPEAPPGLVTFRAAALPDAYPNARAHRCISHETVRMNRKVVAEPGEVER